MAGLFYSKITWSIAIAVLAVTFCFQLGLQYGHARDHAGAAKMEEKLSQWDAKYHEDEAAEASTAQTTSKDALP